MGYGIRFFDFAAAAKAVGAPTAGASREHTVSQIKSANEHAVGGVRKRCTRGKNCSATCIDRDDDCVVGLPESVGIALTQVSKMLRGMVDSGHISEQDAEKVVSSIRNVGTKYNPKVGQGKAYEKFAEAVKSGRLSENDKQGIAKLLISTTLTPGQDRNASRLMNYDEIKAALKPGHLDAFEKAYQASITKEGKFDPSQKGGMGDFIKNNIIKHDISDEAAKHAYDMLPSTMRSAIAKAGAVNQMYAGVDKDGKIITSDKPSEARGVFLIKRWMEQGGLDPYTGRPIDIRNAEPEHLFAFAHAGAKGGGGDQPKNLAWSAAQPNNQKAGSGDNFLAWKKNMENYEKMGREKYNAEVYNPAAQKAEAAKGRKESAKTDIEKALASQTTQDRVQSVKNLVSSYGGEFKYLLRSAGVGWQHQDRDLDHRKGGKPAFMNNGVPKLPGTKVPPSTAVMVALAAVKPSQRQELLKELDVLRQGRILSDSEVQSVRGNNTARLELQTQKSKDYGSKLSKLLNQYVPDLSTYLE
jgi:hypothetical protein